MTIDLEKAVILIVGAIAVQIVLNLANLFKKDTQRDAQHAENKRRNDWFEGKLLKIERALGIDDPDHTAFPRRSEFEDERERVWSELDAHDGRITTLEKRL